MRKMYNDLVNRENMREALITLKQDLKDAKQRQKFEQMTGKNYDFLMKLLVEEDPKVRKNVAALLGVLGAQDALEVLWDAYEAEETLFVKASYLKAMAQLDCSAVLDELKAHLQELTSNEPREDEKKHIQAEISEIQKILLEQGSVKKHSFTGLHVQNEIILTTQKAFMNVTAAQIKNAPVSQMGIGIRTKTTELDDILKIRTFKELLFVIHKVKLLESNPQKIADGLLASDMMEVIEKNHNQAGPFYFRLGIVGNLTMEEKSKLTKKTAALLESGTHRQLINSSSHYEVEIRLIRTKDGLFYPCLKFYTLKDTRFSYRNYHVSTGMQPYIAAGLLKLAEEYTTDHAQVLDPVCGTGTLLIERNYLKPCRSTYGIDIFGEAIEKGRANAKIAKMQVNYINRDFRDFSHAYPFDEIWADMPQKGAISYEELHRLYEQLFAKAEECLKPQGMLFLYSNEAGAVKKMTRVCKDMRLEKEICISEKQGQTLYIIRYK